ncbi:MAG: hypothetical protein C4576_13000 [Desulfobacteraceae bacterium]|nr:MAG: hypothetical protein C4576_13000 [Desulfobacteraceae bacterium]
MIAIERNWWKILALSFFATGIDISGHIMEGTALPQLPLSAISKAIGMRATVVIYFIIWFSILSLVCLYTEKWLSGTRLAKGVRYGISFGVMMFFAACETNTIYGTPLIDDIRIAAVDSIAFVIFGVLAGKTFGTDSPGKQHAATGMSLIPVITITLFYIIGRYFAYSILGIESGYAERPVSTFIWTLSMGFAFGILYILMGRNANDGPIKKAMTFGFLVVGPIALFGNLFFPFEYQSSFEVMIPDYIVGRSIVDMVFITPGVFLGESIIQKRRKHDCPPDIHAR